VELEEEVGDAVAAAFPDVEDMLRVAFLSYELKDNYERNTFIYNTFIFLV